VAAPRLRFVHLSSYRKAPDVPTSGCTAMSEAALTRIVSWLDARKRPLLVALPQAEFNQLRTAAWQIGRINPCVFAVILQNLQILLTRPSFSLCLFVQRLRANA
jgi:hypothetical protein